MVALPSEFMLNQNEITDRTIYHYCSMETFLKIIHSKTLWLTSVEKMNDFAEASWFTHLGSGLINLDKR